MSHFHVVEAIQTRGSSMLRNAIRVDAPLGREKGSLPKWFSNDLPKANRQYMKDAFDAADDINSESVSTDDPKKPKNFPNQSYQNMIAKRLELYTTLSQLKDSNNQLNQINDKTNKTDLDNILLIKLSDLIPLLIEILFDHKHLLKKNFYT